MFKLKGLDIYKDDIYIGRFTTGKANTVELKRQYLTPELVSQLSRYYGIFALDVRSVE